VGLADGRATQALIAASQDPDREVRLRAVTALGALGPLGQAGASEAVPRLSTLLGDADTEVARAAAQALGRGGEVQVQPALLHALGAIDRRVRRAAGDALVELAGRGDALGSIQALLAWLSTAPPHARADGLVVLGGLLRHQPEAHARALLVSGAEGSDAALAESSLTALGLARDPAAVAPLVRMLDTTAPERRHLVVQALGEIGGPAARQALVQALGHTTPAVRAEAAWALGKAGESGRLAALAALLADKDAAVRINAAAALARLGAPVPALPLDDRDPFVRANAALAAPEAALPGVAWLARHDPEPFVRAAALRRLGRGTLPAQVLRGAEQDPAPLVRVLARRLEGASTAAPAPASPAPGDGVEGRPEGSGGVSASARDLRFYLTDEDGKTLANRAVRLLLVDGLIKATMSDARGLVYETAAPAGESRLWWAPPSPEGQASP
jgi:HEAT repeat protein